MNKTWMAIILLISLTLLLVLKTNEKRSLSPYFKSEPTLKLHHFSEARKIVSKDELPLLELWESMLTGRVAPLDRWLRHEYKTLALAHVFTPSGFHLSALLWPLLFFLRKRVQKLWTLGLIELGLLFLPGQGALKRVTMVKFQQQIFGMKTGFILAVMMDMLWGSFCDSPLGFTYSFLFLGIIYSGARGLTVVIWFFLAQILIAYVQGSLVSPLLVLTSPLINSFLALILPLLFLLAFPLWNWQVHTGIFLLKCVQWIVSYCYAIVVKLPLLEINIFFLLLITVLIFRKGKIALLMSVLLTADLNTDQGKIPLSGSYEWQAKGEISKIIGEKVYRSDGICNRVLVRGMWIETCSPRRKSRKKKIN